MPEASHTTLRWRKTHVHRALYRYKENTLYRVRKKDASEEHPGLRVTAVFFAWGERFPYLTNCMKSRLPQDPKPSLRRRCFSSRSSSVGGFAFPWFL